MDTFFSDEFLDTFTEDMVDTLCAISDVTMRTHAFISKIAELDADIIAEIFQRIIGNSKSDDSRYHLIMLCLLDVATFSDRLGNERMSEIYIYAKENDLTGVVELLIRPPAHKTHKIIEHYSEDDTPLGVKITQSKLQNKFVIDKLIHSGNPMVIRTLLQNPRLTESEVLKIASKRPVAAEILTEIYRNRKWLSRYPIKRALVLNPYSPPEIGLKLINFLLVQDLREVVKNYQLHETIREAAAQRLESQKHCQ